MRSGVALSLFPHLSTRQQDRTHATRVPVSLGGDPLCGSLQGISSFPWHQMTTQSFGSALMTVPPIPAWSLLWARYGITSLPCPAPGGRIHVWLCWGQLSCLSAPLGMPGCFSLLPSLVRPGLASRGTPWSLLGWTHQRPGDVIFLPAFSWG